MLAGPRELPVTQAVSGGQCRIPIDVRCVEDPKSRTEDFLCGIRRWHRVLDHSVEATEERTIEQPRVIGRSHKNALGCVLLEELQEGIEDTSDLSNVVSGRPFSTERIELI